MNTLKINLKNCYGIRSLEETLDFRASTHGKPRAYAIYAPNGTMKTSFSKTFEDLSKGDLPKEERYNNPSTCVVELDDASVVRESVYVLKAELDISNDSPSITNILVNPNDKERYDELLIDLDKLKIKLIKELTKLSGLKQNEVEGKMLFDWQEEDFFTCVQKIQEIDFEDDLSPYIYNIIFDPKALAVLDSDEFSIKAQEFNRRYQEVFEKEGSIYQKGVFNPNKAETSFKTLNKQGFFAGGHRVHLKGDDSSIDKNELFEKVKAINANIDGDADLKKIKDGLAKNAQTDALAGLIETLSAPQFEYLLENVKSQNQNTFKRLLWTSYIQNAPGTAVFLDTYRNCKDEIEQIESEAANSAPRWEKAVGLFNDRFVDMPFELTIPNQTQAVLGRQTAILNFIFKDDPHSLSRTRDNVRTSLSQGERRALYLLNFIFDVEERIMNEVETVFILDDVADSFDYKNKHAIIQYLRDLINVEFFYQIILTHNFDFFRALSQGNGGFVHRQRCFMTSKSDKEISFVVAEGVSNYFVFKWKPRVHKCDRVMYATIPFTRNLIEYTTPNYQKNGDYLKLTSLLHWKQDTDSISVGEYFHIYNSVFNDDKDEGRTDKLIDVLYSEAQNICDQANDVGLDLESKVLLSVAIRMKAEKVMTEKLRNVKNDPSYWYQGKSDQFRGLFEEYKQIPKNHSNIRTLERVGITVNSNIHLNSFMYEPILDLTIEHLISLYNEVDALDE
ncbi:MAG: AAA family ATPase [Halomonas sp.]|nr:AAA family ATPase [Halomonas sp.]MCC5903093.1 AAA family ATPase [Halomonas sp.]